VRTRYLSGMRAILSLELGMEVQGWHSAQQQPPRLVVHRERVKIANGWPASAALLQHINGIKCSEITDTGVVSSTILPQPLYIYSTGLMY
jgi:hypothetical protein